MDNFVSDEIVINVPIGILWIILLLNLLFVAACSWILVHHWGYFGIKGNNKIFAKSLYFIGVVTFFVISILLLGAYDFI